MHTSRAERPQQLYFEVGRWSIRVVPIIVTLVFVVVVAMLVSSARKNNTRAEDWRQRAVAAEELVGGLRVVLGERSQALNERTRQANELATTLASSQGLLRATKVNVGALTRRQRQLATEKARTEAERLELQSQRAAYASVASALSTCSERLGAVVAEAQQGKPRIVLAKADPVLAQCSTAQERLSAIPKQTTPITPAPSGPVGEPR